MKDVFSVEVRLPSVKGEFGREPTLKRMIYQYYRQAFDDETAMAYTEEYIEELSRIIGDQK